jgi:16S rRNA (cytosine1402-N4)-methyltransferase
MMAGRDTGTPAVAGGSAPHIPVLVRQVIDALQPKDGAIYIDGTFGGGGHARALLSAAETRVIGLDRDQRAIALGADLVETAAGRLTLVEANFATLDAVAHGLGVDLVDGVLLDLGVSSMQLEDAGRGFSFRHDGPLDMRMGGAGPSAADVLARASEPELASIIAILGEERHARALARAIVRARRETPINTTAALARIVRTVVPRGARDLDPATRTFQALRIFVNGELHALETALFAAQNVLKPGGRLAVIAFHSLEDRIIKNFLVARSRSIGSSRHLPEQIQPAPSFRLLTKRPIGPDMEEVAANPRARSAKLRAAERTQQAPVPAKHTSLVPQLPVLGDLGRGR